MGASHVTSSSLAEWASVLIYLLNITQGARKTEKEGRRQRRYRERDRGVERNKSVRQRGRERGRGRERDCEGLGESEALAGQADLSHL